MTAARSKDPSPWNWSVVTALDSFRELKSDWKTLHRHSGFPTVFGLYDLHHAWFVQHQQDWCLRTVVGRDSSGTVRFIGPFVARKHSPHVWHFGLPEHCDYDTLLFQSGDDGSVFAFRDWLRAYKESISISLQSVVLNSVSSTVLSSVTRGNNRLLNAFRLLFSRSPIFYRVPHANHPYLSDANVSIFKHALDDKRHARNLEWFERKRPVRFETHDDPQAVSSLLPRFFEFHRAQWGPTAPDLFTKDRRNLSFLQSLCSEATPDFPLRLHVLSWGDTWLAAHLGFEWNSRLYWYLPAHNLEFASRGPGKLLLAFLLRGCARKGGIEFDFLRGTEPYKLEVTTTVRTSERLDIFSSRWSLIHFLGGKISYVR